VLKVLIAAADNLTKLAPQRPDALIGAGNDSAPNATDAALRPPELGHALAEPRCESRHSRETRRMVCRDIPGGEKKEKRGGLASKNKVSARQMLYSRNNARLAKNAKQEESCYCTHHELARSARGTAPRAPRSRTCRRRPVLALAATDLSIRAACPLGATQYVCNAACVQYIAERAAPGISPRARVIVSNLCVRPRRKR
jgi:hypothetical protein